MDSKMLARLGAVVFLTIAITAAVVEMTRKDGEPAAVSPARIVEPVRDPLREGQRRCQQLGQEAATDAECLRVWAETRDRFLRPTSAPAPPSSSQGR